jgi:hypothetical protein
MIFLGNGNMSFDTFIQACVTVKSLTDSFHKLDSGNSGSVQLKLDQVSLYLHLLHMLHLLTFAFLVLRIIHC